MISIKSSVTELELSYQLRTVVLDCYSQAIKNVAHYAVELEGGLTADYRKHLNDLAAEIAPGEPEVLQDSRATLRSLLRDYRNRAAQYLTRLHDELAGTVRALQEILDALGQADGDHDAQLRGALSKLRMAASDPVHAEIASVVTAAADTIENTLEQMRKQHQLTTAQFLVEIRMLHQRIDSLETAASIDKVTQFANQQEMEQRIQSTAPGGYCLLLIGARGLRRAETQFGSDLMDQLSGAFAKRLLNSLPATAVVSRWGPEHFVVMLDMKKSEATASGQWITENMSGAYVCLKDGKTVRPNLQLSVGVVETASSDSAPRIVQRVCAFLGIPT
jgi:GGDEF domain-containing protein